MYALESECCFPDSLYVVRLRAVAERVRQPAPVFDQRVKIILLKDPPAFLVIF